MLGFLAKLIGRLILCCFMKCEKSGSHTISYQSLYNIKLYRALSKHVLSTCKITSLSDLITPFLNITLIYSGIPSR